MNNHLNAMNALLQTAIDAAQKAGKVLKEGFGTDYTISSKSQIHDLVTEYDHKSEAIIIETIRSSFPNHQILTEESGHHASDGDIIWIIDPLDGTVNFAHGIPFFCVSIAAIQRSDILCGVIYSPMTEELFSAEKNGGAFLNGQSYKVTQQNSLLHSFLVTGFPYSVKENPLHCIEHFAHIVGMGIPIRRLGSAALDLAYVAVGRFDGFWEVALQPWDMAAGALLVKEAGGIVIDYSGNDLNVMQSSSIIAGNSNIVKALRNEIDSFNLTIPKR
ncbi:MAG: inositol monophosphatase [Ignavibacteriae bacterium]|nr:inositol monophosphatase [Ignavibacteriota bacterium]